MYACSLYLIKKLFCYGQSFEYIHECVYILKNKKPVEGRSYLLQRKVPLLIVLSHAASKNMQSFSQNTKENSKTSTIF